MMLTFVRAFSFKPSTPLSFTNQKSLILSHQKINSMTKLIDAVLITTPSLMLFRLFKNFSAMGYFNIFFSTGLFISTSTLTKNWFGIKSLIINELYLLDDGQHIEIKPCQNYQRTIKIKISDIINPEENLANKLKIAYFNTWVLETKKSQSFYILPDPAVTYPEVLKEILKGNDIEIAKNLKKSDENIIDI